MAKANNTAMENMVEYMDKMLAIEVSLIENHAKTRDDVEDIKANILQLSMIKEMAFKLLQLNRLQIEAAFNAGKTNNYQDSGHYFFMQYIDND